MKRRVQALRKAGASVEYREYEGLGHGFGLGTGTRAEGWASELSGSGSRREEAIV